MNTKKLFKDSLSYPIQDIDKLLTLGVLFFFDAILSLLPSIAMALNQNLATQTLYFFSNIVGIIIIIIAGGYLLDIIKNTIEDTPTIISDNNSSNISTNISDNNSTNISTNNSNDIANNILIDSKKIPSINIFKNLVGGIKVGIVSIIYYIIPITLTIIIAYINGTFNFITKLLYSYMYFSPEIIANDLLSFDLGNILLTLIITVILFTLMSLILSIAIARLANTNSIKSALNIKKIFSDISKIDWLSYIVYYIVFVLILCIILIISLIISVIPFLGFILLFLLVIPFIIMFFGRTIGLIYKKSNNNTDNTNNTNTN